MKVKRFAVFLTWKHYPSGGWEDFKGSFDSLTEAQVFAKWELGIYYDNQRQYGNDYEHGHIVDLESGKVVWREYFKA